MFKIDNNQHAETSALLHKLVSKDEICSIISNIENNLFVKTTSRDFRPINQWQVEELGKTTETWHNYGVKAKFIVDQTTGKRYLNQSTINIRTKCFALSFVTLFLQPILFTINAIAHIYDSCVKLAHGEVKKGFLEIAKTIGRIILFPFTLIALEFAALYGVFNPYDGRKLYASIERVGLGGPIFLAPCFQPDPKSHFFGGDINAEAAW